MSKTCESCSPIVSRPYTPEGEATWDRVFGEKKFFDVINEIDKVLEEANGRGKSDK